MRFARLLTLLLLLQSRGQVTARELATALEVSVRTVHRDIEALSSAGVPVYAERGARGGFRLLDGYRLPVQSLTDEEVAVLHLLGMPTLAADLGMSRAYGAAVAKLEATLSASQRAVLERTRALVMIEAGSGATEQERVWLRGWLDASNDGLRVAITARPTSHPASHPASRPASAAPTGQGGERLIDAAGVTFEGGRWTGLGSEDGASVRVALTDIARMRVVRMPSEPEGRSAPGRSWSERGDG